MAEEKILPESSENDELEDGIVTMVDVLKAEEFLEENAVAVLGPGDDKNCTYNEGYLKRQALYSCLTCLPADGKETAGVCLACSYHCHADHDLVELYTKRNFRCDCGNSLFKGRSCTLDPVKSDTNEENLYNQNFRGTYCICARPYPDPDDTVGDEMIQCIICEDWYHTKHLDTEVPKEDDYGEMICGSCTDKLPFLRHYLGYSVSKLSKAEETNESDANLSVTECDSSLNISNDQDGDVSSTNKAADKLTEDKTTTEDKKESPLKNQEGNNDSIGTEESETSEQVETKKPVILEESLKTINENASTSPTKDSVPNAASKSENECLLKDLKMLPRGTGATFWPDGFRKLLCVCISCKELYKSEGVSFLTDDSDTVQAYEEQGKSHKNCSGATQYEQGMEALSSLDRVQQMEAILSFNDMKTHLSAYLAKFVENKKVVREEDIREFFTGMQARKRQKLDIPYNCR